MNIKTDLIPPDTLKRPGTNMSWETITVHNTANSKSSAENEREWLTNPTNNRQASWHYVVCEDTIIQAIPDNEIAWHAGDGRKGPGNTTSLSIEICESGDFEKSKQTAAKFIALKLKEKNKDTLSVKRHYDWSGKNCPRLLIPIWGEFIEMIKKEITETEFSNVASWKLDGLKYLHAKGYISDYKGWASKIDESLPAWAVFTILANMDRKG